jgi:hypothetical protein
VRLLLGVSVICGAANGGAALQASLFLFGLLDVCYFSGAMAIGLVLGMCRTMRVGCTHVRVLSSERLAPAIV